MSEEPDRTGTGRVAALRAAGWAVYLGNSWTWVIGMFLPVILVREYGTWGWIAFAAPNVIGAAAMGWVLRSRQSSARLVETHLSACAAFSWVTVAFHLFFALWMVRAAAGDRSDAALAVLGVLTLLAWAAARWDRGAMFAALAAYVLSLCAFVFVLQHGATLPPMTGDEPMAELPWLALVCVFGFTLCPYLDLTFHRARQGSGSPAEARAAFSVGFGVIFLVMIVFTLLYAWWDRRLVLSVVALEIAAHWVVQSGLTMGLHLRELTARRTPLVAGGVVLLLAAAGVGLTTDFTYAGLDGGEVVYRLFMGFYGLVFPAYVWLCVIPTRGRSRPTGRMVAVFAIATIVAAPFYWLGFIEGRMGWLGVGLAIVLAARLGVGSCMDRAARAHDPSPTGRGSG